MTHAQTAVALDPKAATTGSRFSDKIMLKRKI